MSTHMVDITPKIHVKRIATAEGFIKLKRETLTLIREGRVRKGDVFSVAKIAGILAAKNVPQIIPLCHQIPLTHVDLNFKLEEDGVRVKAVVKAIAKTGVEMEALTAVSVALLTIWDMVKEYEKDEAGQYPYTEIRNIKVIEKKKEEI
ncbi:MAG: cyclic pyranopterin monophosphate synthase MoaC [Thermoprotei archaeon]|nr:MAG: cyclic pyranopterin monophosphate synthase MoaC [Thermoprotei archaeon]